MEIGSGSAVDWGRRRGDHDLAGLEASPDPTASPNSDQPACAEFEEFLDHDRHARGAHAAGLNAHGNAFVRSGVSEETAMCGHLARRSGAAVELLGDPSGAVGVAGEQHDRSVVLGFGAEMDLRHRLLPGGLVTRMVGGGPPGPARLRRTRFYVVARPEDGAGGPPPASSLRRPASSHLHRPSSRPARARLGRWAAIPLDLDDVPIDKAPRCRRVATEMDRFPDGLGQVETESVRLGVDKLWKTWDTYARTMCSNAGIHRMVPTSHRGSGTSGC